MALTQMQTIQSLGDALAWLEREVAWGVDPRELRHLCGRIGELYACVISNGQMAVSVNQRGYDVVGASGERISVKTTAVPGPGHVALNPRTLSEVDRILVLRINMEEAQVETILDLTTEEARQRMTGDAAKAILRFAGRPKVAVERGAPVCEIAVDEYIVSEHENGAISVSKNGVGITPVKPVLRLLAQRLSLGLLNSRGNPYNTQQLGTHILNAAMAMRGALPSAE